MAKKEKAVASVETIELEINANAGAITELEKWIELAGGSGVISVSVNDLQKLVNELK